MSTQILLCGYFGCGNLGDDAILVGLSEAIADLDVKFTMLSGAPDETFRLYGMRSIPRRDLKQVQQAILESDYVVFPGGSIFQDVTSVRSAAYYNSLVRRAKKAGKKAAKKPAKKAAKKAKPAKKKAAPKKKGAAKKSAARKGAKKGGARKPARKGGKKGGRRR